MLHLMDLSVYTEIFVFTQAFASSLFRPTHNVVLRAVQTIKASISLG